MKTRSRPTSLLPLCALALVTACETPETLTSSERDPAVPGGGTAAAHSFDSSTGIYRIGYVDGTTLVVSNDHHDHNPVNRIDMVADEANVAVVAAASGIIRAVLDRHGNSGGNGDGLSADQSQAHDDALEHSCQDDTTVIMDCQDYNNFVWIEHPNGEWTKYTHFQTGSVTANGWQVGDWIEVGQVLGIEGDVGRASGRHLHWEVALPNDPEELTPFSPLGGFIDGQGVNLAPRICDITNNLYQSNAPYVANPCNNALPTADAGGPYVVDEGSTVVLDGTGSDDPDGEPLTFLWSPADALDDASLAEPTFTAVDDGVTDLTLTVYDNVEARSASAATTVTVNNVDPTVTIDPAQVTSVVEGTTLAVSASFSDPGVLDAPFTASVECYDAGDYDLVVDGVVSIDGTSGGITGTITAECPFGDTSRSGNPPTGTFTVKVSLSDKDGGSDEASFNVTVTNEAPTVAIDGAGSEEINGVATFIGSLGQPLELSGDVTDPGSDDLLIVWDWADGSTDPTTSLLDSPNADPFPSPTVDPRNVATAKSHTWTQACYYTISLTATDDDGGEGSDEANVIMAGTSGRARGVGYWLPQYKSKRSNVFTPATLTCYLEIAEFMSAVFDEERAGTGSFAEAARVLATGGSKGVISEEVDQQLLAAWLNFANGGFGWDQLVDTNRDLLPDTPFSSVITAAEAVRLDADATRAQLVAQKNILESVNLMHGG